MTAAVSAARWAAVSELQRIRSRTRDPLRAESADYAIDLILSPDRAEGPYLVRNALRDARSILIRRGRRERQRFTSLTDENKETGILAAVETDQQASASRPPSAETLLGWKRDLALVKQSVKSRSRRAADVLDIWLDEGSVADTARSLGVTAHAVKKMRGNIRRYAKAATELRLAA